MIRLGHGLVAGRPSAQTLLLLPRRRTVRCSAAVLLALVVATARLAAAEKTGPAVVDVKDYAPAEMIAQLEHRDIVESSGLAVSIRHSGPGGEIFWTHNDSGDEPRLFAFDSTGRHRACCRLEQAEAIDWEDVGSFQLRGRPYLFVADVGDNTKRRQEVTIYLIDEPPLGDTTVQARPLRFKYDDGPRDCEAVALDTEQQVFILVEKANVPGFPSRVYQLPWKTRLDGQRVAERIGRLQRGALPVPWVTGMDISPDGRRAVVATYSSIGLQFLRQKTESWGEALARAPQDILLPGMGEGRRQGESIAYGRDGTTLYLTSEKHPCPLFVIRPARLPASVANSEDTQQVPLPASTASSEDTQQVPLPASAASGEGLGEGAIGEGRH